MTSKLVASILIAAATVFAGELAQAAHVSRQDPKHPQCEYLCQVRGDAPTTCHADGCPDKVQVSVNGNQKGQNWIQNGSVVTVEFDSSYDMTCRYYAR